MEEKISCVDNKETQSINKELEEIMDAMLFCNSIVFPMVLKAAIELDIFGIIAKAGPGAHISASEVASQLPTSNPSAPSILDRMLRFLASHSMLSYSFSTLEDGQIEKLYGLTPASQHFHGNNGESCLSDLLALSYHPAALQVRLNMKDVVLEETGDFFKKSHGMTMFEYMKIDPTFNNIFNKAMAANSLFIMKGILEVYKGFKGLSSLVDVGGGTGKSLHMIHSNYPYIKGINYDLPHVIQSAPSYPGIQHISGDMFSSVPTAEAIMLKDVCHNWADENCIKLLENCYKALPTGGKVIIITAILPEEPDSSKSSRFVSSIDNIMITVTSSGKERTAKEFETLCKKAGFSNFQAASSFQGIRNVIEFYK